MDTPGNHKYRVLSSAREGTSRPNIAGNSHVSPRIVLPIDEEEARNIFHDGHVPAAGPGVLAGFSAAFLVVCYAFGGWEEETALALPVLRRDKARDDGRD